MAARVQALCLDKDGSKTVKSLVSPYRNAAEHAMLTEDLWNLPDDYRTGQYFRGGVDRTCADTDEAAMQDWCSWIRWNLPGPLGEHPFPKVPEVGGQPVPVLIVQGADDNVIHCMPADGDDATSVPPAANCMSAALFDSMRDSDYCPATGDEAHLRLSVFAKDGSASPASHLSIPGQIAAVGTGRNDADLTFEGSRLDEFFTGAFAGSLEPGCTAELISPSDPAT